MRATRPKGAKLHAFVYWLTGLKPISTTRSRGLEFRLGIAARLIDNGVGTLVLPSVTLGRDF